MTRLEAPAATYYIGTAREIRSLYDNMNRKTVYWPLFTEEPIFNPNKMYGIMIYEDDDFPQVYNSYTVIGETDCVYVLLGFVNKEEI